MNLDSEGTLLVLEWMNRLTDQGVHFITTNASMRSALLMPGTAFYLEEGKFCQVEVEEETGKDPEEEDIRILKIAAKSGSSTLLFEPKDIDFVESMNKCNYVSVRGTLFQVSMTMDEMEGMLANQEQSRIPLSKGRIDEMKSIFGW